MYIEVNTTHHITRQESLKAEVAAMVDHALVRFADQITHVEVHLDDENSVEKGGNNDIRCTIETRVIGHQSLGVTAHESNVEKAARGAAAKLARALESSIGRQISRQRTAAKNQLSSISDGAQA